MALPWLLESLTRETTAPQMPPKLHACRRHLIARQLAASCTPQSLPVPISLTPFRLFHVFSTTPALFTGRPSSVSSATWLAPEILHSPTATSGMTSQATLTQMAPQRSIAMRSPDMLFSLMEEQYHGTHAN